MKVIVFYKPDKSCIFAFPFEGNKLSEDDEQQWLEKEYLRLLPEFQVEYADIATYEYDFFDVSQLPEKRFIDGIEGTKADGVYVNMEKYELARTRKVYEERIVKKQTLIARELAIEQLKTEGQIPQDYV